MASTTALFTGLTGLNANARNLDVIGNNIANGNTVAFKSARANFETMFSRTFNAGTPPGDTVGGTNPFQIGYGVRVSGTQKNFATGTISPTGDLRDLAIDGDGFFVVNRGTQPFYTRAGNFRPDAEQYLATPSGERLQGYGIDENFNIVPGRLGDMRIPLGTLTIAEATQNVRFRGNLDASGSIPSQGSNVNLLGTQTDGLRAIAAAAPAPAPGNLIEGTTRLVDIEDPELVGSGTPMFLDGQSIELRNIEKGGRTLPTAIFPITTTSTLDDLMTFMRETIGINGTTGANPDGNTPGVTLDPTTGVVSITGNTGTVNDIAIDSSDMRLLNASGQVVRQPFVPQKTAAADGESVRTTFIVYDSLGTPVEVDLAMTLEGKSNAGTTWRYTIESADATGPDLAITTGVLAFDTEGQLDTTVPIAISIDRSDTGADSPLGFSLSFAEGDDTVTALTDETSSVAATYRDGAPIGTLSGFGIGIDGFITGKVANGPTRTIGQVALATFPNNEGLVDQGGNLFGVGANSGSPIVTTPTVLGAGRTIGGALELSNVDLGEEFIKMILASTGYSASSRVIRTADELMQQLLVLGR